MGLSIHYKGKFNESSSLSDMIEEVKDISVINNWKYEIFEREFPKNEQTNINNLIYGIIFVPPGSEPVYLTFLSNKKMSNSINLKIYGNSEDEKEKEYLYMLFTKTQFAGKEIHKMIILLLKHLSKKYFSEFILNDESRYWETGDEKILSESFDRYNLLFDLVETAFENIPKNNNESVEEYIARIIKTINDKKKK